MNTNGRKKTGLQAKTAASSPVADKGNPTLIVAGGPWLSAGVSPSKSVSPSTLSSCSSSQATKRSLIGGIFSLSSNGEDDASLSSTSLIGAGYCETSEDERSQQMQPRSLLGDFLTLDRSRSQYLLEQPSDSESSASEQSSLDDDIYFLQNPVEPLLGRHDSFNLERDVQDLLFDHTDASTDVEVYEDESSTSNYPTDDDRSDASSFRYGRKSRSELFDWSAYNQERGRYLAQRLISKARGVNGSYKPSASYTMPQMRPEYSAEKNKPQPTLKAAVNLIGRRKLEKDFTVVDATVKDPVSPPPIQKMAYKFVSTSSFASSDTGESWPISEGPGSPESTDIFPYSSIPSYRLFEETVSIPAGLAPRSTVEDIIAELKLGPPGVAALQEMNRALLHGSFEEECIPTVLIHGIYKVPNYKLYVEHAVANFRRHVLQLSDQSFEEMLSEEQWKHTEIAME